MAYRKNWGLKTAVALCTLSACTGTADVFPLNSQAKAYGPVTATFGRTGLGHGPVKIVLADGEVLTGTYKVAFGSADALGSLGSNLIITDGPMQFVATGPKTQILCRGKDSTLGHGNGECQTYDGALWAIDW